MKFITKARGVLGQMQIEQLNRHVSGVNNSRILVYYYLFLQTLHKPKQPHHAATRVMDRGVRAWFRATAPGQLLTRDSTASVVLMQAALSERARH